MSKALYWIAGKHWWLISFISFCLISLELYDLTHLPANSRHIVEAFIYLFLLVIVGRLLDLLLQAMQAQDHTLKILDFKHKMSLEFLAYEDWDTLVTQLVKFPGSIAPIDHIGLYMGDLISNQFELAAQWGTTGVRDERGVLGPCRNCMAQRTFTDLIFDECESFQPNHALPHVKKYCLPIRSGDTLFAMLQFTMKPEQGLTSDQVNILKSLSDEFAVVLKAGQNRRTTYEMHASETALGERRSISHYLHDNLGQNLGYLLLKLDQLVSEREQLSSKKVFSEIEHMRDAANVSYDIVRGMLETMQPETMPQLTNLLTEYGKRVAQRAKFEIDFKTRGKPSPVTVDIQRMVFYVFQEALSNVERHARANKVDVVAEWGNEELAIHVSDDGVGFDPQAVDTNRHFGLEIMRERMATVKGDVMLTENEHSGTTVNLWVPIPTVRQLKTS